MTTALLLDEMHAPLIAFTLRNRGRDVIAVADQLTLRAMPDAELFRWAGVANGGLAPATEVKPITRLS